MARGLGIENSDAHIEAAREGVDGVVNLRKTRLVSVMACCAHVPRPWQGRHAHRVLQLALIGLKLGADRVGAAALARGRNRCLELGLEARLSLRHKFRPRIVPACRLGGRDRDAQLREVLDLNLALDLDEQARESYDTLRLQIEGKGDVCRVRA